MISSGLDLSQCFHPFSIYLCSRFVSSYPLSLFFDPAVLQYIGSSITQAEPTRETFTTSVHSLVYCLTYLNFLLSFEPCSSSLTVPYCCGLLYICSFYLVWSPFPGKLRCSFYGFVILIFLHIDCCFVF